jgi:hypothetical protein
MKKILVALMLGLVSILCVQTVNAQETVQTSSKSLEGLTFVNYSHYESSPEKITSVIYFISSTEGIMTFPDYSQTPRCLSRKVDFTYQLEGNKITFQVKGHSDASIRGYVAGSTGMYLNVCGAGYSFLVWK